MSASEGILTNKVAVVTGGAAGIGGSISREMAAEGAYVVVIDNDAERLGQIESVLSTSARRCLVLRRDCSDVDQLTSGVNAAVEAFGRIDILVNNVGGVRRQYFADQSLGSFRRHVDLNLMSVFWATSAALPAIVRGGTGGSVLNVASIEGLRGAPQHAVYAACKAAIVSFTRSLAVELGGQGIRVNALAPDVIATPGLRGMRAGAVPDALPPMPEGQAAGMRRYVPLGFEGAGSDCAAAAVFLASERARYITGVTLSVDGGTWASSGWVRDPATESEWQPFDDAFTPAGTPAIPDPLSSVPTH